MSLRKNSYIDRLVDKKIEEYLSVFGAVSIEGPKWCGKTWASLNHANSMVLLDDEEIREKAKLDLNLILKGEKPELIDEWNIMPEIWDAVRRKCDDTTEKGNYILTCSTKLTDADKKEKIHHSGAGRIGKIEMHTMSLFESGDSTGKVSIQDLLNNKLQNSLNDEITLEKLAYLIIRGGWPSNIKIDEKKANIIPKSYIKAILDKDIHEDKKRDVNKMKMLLKSLARNESTIVNKNTLLRDIEENAHNKEFIESRTTIDDYLDILSRLHIIDNQDAYSENYRSPERIGKSAKRHFTDPSLACACLDLSIDKLINDLKTFGFMFEALVERDLKIYMNYLDGNVFHFRDNVTGLEVDSIIEFSDGEYAAVEIKLGNYQVEEAKKNLINFSKAMVKKPKFMCVIVGYSNVIARDSETGIYIVPITALKP